MALSETLTKKYDAFRERLQPVDEAGDDHAVRGYLLAGYVSVFLLVFCVAGWAAVASLAGAVIAPGQVVVDSSVKRVQHPTGGVVGEIRVKNGDRVQAGDQVLRLDDTVTRANLGVVMAQLTDLMARFGRLQAERDGLADIQFPADFATKFPDAPAAMASEQRLLTSRTEGRSRQKEQLRERVTQLNLEIEAVELQATARQRQMDLIDRELDDVRGLFKRNLVPLTRIMPLEREAARLQGEFGAMRSQQARTRAQIAETELQVIGVDQDARNEVLKDLREVEAKIAELAERRTAAEDQLRRTDLRAPVTGLVHELAVHTVGGVVNPGEAIMLVVPESEKLAIEVRINPIDIDQVTIGHPAALRFSAFNQRTTPELRGTIARVAADATVDKQTGQSYYLARVAVDDEQLAKLEQLNLKLVPGMPVESFVETGDRTVLSYFLKPLTDQFRRAFREE